MWVQVRTMDGKSVQIDKLSKLTTIEDLKVKIAEKFDVATGRQRLFFSGKQVNFTTNQFLQIFLQTSQGQELKMLPLSCLKETR